MAFSHQSSPKPKKKPSPLNFQTHVCNNTRTFKMVQRKERKISHVKLHFSPHFGALLEALRSAFPRWKKWTPRLHNYGKWLVFFINQQSWLASKKNGLRQYQWKLEMMKKKSDPPHCPLVTVDFATKRSAATPAETRSD